MPFPFDIWAPILKAPFSGDVTQEIVPRVMSPDIKGSPAIEARVQADVASFGRQLGKILEALQTVSEATQVPLPEIDCLLDGIENVKTTCKDELLEEAEVALKRLRQADEASYQQLLDSRLSCTSATSSSSAASVIPHPRLPAKRSTRP